MEKILLINCLKNDIEYLREFLSRSLSEEFDMAEIINTRNLPIGLMSIESYVNKMCKNVEVDILDLNLEFLTKHLYFDENGKINLNKNIDIKLDNFIFNTIKDKMIEFKPNIIGISLLFDTGIKNLLNISEVIKEIDTSVLVISGGHASHNLYKEILENCSSIDAISIGEGEIPFVELINSSNKEEYIEQSNYFASKSKVLKDQCKNLYGTFVENLDDIPMYNYKKIIDKYGRFATFFPHRFMYPENIDYNTVTFFTSRGCLFDCIFCSSTSIHGKRIRTYSLERVKKEIDYLIDELKVNLISIDDDHLLFDVDRAINIIDYIGSRGVYMEFTSSIALYPINQKFVDALVRNNVKVVQLALESGSEYVLSKIINKPLNLKKASEVLELFSHTNIYVIANVVIGFPNETEDNVRETIEFLEKNSVNWIQCFSPSPISGSRLYSDSIKNGYLKNYDISKSLASQNVFQNTTISEEKLKGIRYYLNLKINFVDNYHIRIGQYEYIINRFKNIIEKNKTHAFAYFCLYKCMVNLNYDYDSIDLIKAAYNKILKENNFWYQYAIEFKLPLEL